MGSNVEYRIHAGFARCWMLRFCFLIPPRKTLRARGKLKNAYLDPPTGRIEGLVSDCPVGSPNLSVGKRDAGNVCCLGAEVLLFDPA